MQLHVLHANFTWIHNFMLKCKHFLSLLYSLSYTFALATCLSNCANTLSLLWQPKLTYLNKWKPHKISLCHRGRKMRESSRAAEQPHKKNINNQNQNRKSVLTEKKYLIKFPINLFAINHLSSVHCLFVLISFRYRICIEVFIHSQCDESDRFISFVRIVF